MLQPSPSHSSHPLPTVLESALRHERGPLVVLALCAAAAWAWIVVMARDMYGPMTGASAWMMTLTWDVPHLLLLWAMWAVMMGGMMLPSASPLLLLYGFVVRKAGYDTAARQVYALAAGYLSVWTIFSLGATVLQRLLASRLVISPMMEPTSAHAGALLLLVAGVYQLTPLKQACLRTCQAPLRFLMKRRRTGIARAFRLGLEHGAHCVGCCWTLMLLLFVGGVMNLAAIAAVTTFVTLEKLGLLGVQSARLSGALLILAGLWKLTHQSN